MTKFAKLIGEFEGFYKAGSQPQRKHNPGDLRHSPHSSHVGEGPDDIGIIDSDADGWEDLERQLSLYAERGLTIEAAIKDYAPTDENDTDRYLAFICQGLTLPPGAPMAEALKIAA